MNKVAVNKKIYTQSGQQEDLHPNGIKVKLISKAWQRPVP